MPAVNIEFVPLLRGVLDFITYMGLAIFAENVILARALGVTRPSSAICGGEKVQESVLVPVERKAPVLLDQIQSALEEEFLKETEQ